MCLTTKLMTLGLLINILIVLPLISIRAITYRYNACSVTLVNRNSRLGSSSDIFSAFDVHLIVLLPLQIITLIRPRLLRNLDFRTAYQIIFAGEPLFAREQSKITRFQVGCACRLRVVNSMISEKYMHTLTQEEITLISSCRMSFLL